MSKSECFLLKNYFGKAKVKLHIQYIDVCTLLCTICHILIILANVKTPTFSDYPSFVFNERGKN